MEDVVQDQPRRSKGAAKESSGPYIKRVTGDEREDEMEENLQ